MIERRVLRVRPHAHGQARAVGAPRRAADRQERAQLAGAVDPGGRIRIGDDVPESEGPGLSEIHQAVFAARDE